MENFDKDFKGELDKVAIPDSLLPENVAKMLSEKAENRSLISPSTANNTNTTKSPIKIKVYSRVLASVAACAVLVVGVSTFFKNDESKEIIPAKNSGVNFETELAPADDYTELYNTFQKIYATSHDNSSSGNPVVDFFSGLLGGNKETNNNSQNTITEDNALGSPESSKGEVTDSQKGESNDDFSKTHSQVEGVDEADIIKTDGENIYYIANQTLYIVSTENGKMTLLSKTSTENFSPVEMFLVGEKLVLISDKFEPLEENTVASKSKYSEDDVMIDWCMPAGNSSTQVNIFDISKKDAPTVLKSYLQDGAYISSRMLGDNLYLVTNYCDYNYAPIEDEKDLDSFVPKYYVGNEKCFISPADISIPQKVDNTNYTVVAGLDISAENPLVSIKAVLGYSGTVYASKENVYVAGLEWGEKNQYTNIVRFSLNKGNLTHTGFCKVDGYMLNQFSMDEFDGKLRVATTNGQYKRDSQSSGVYVFDGDLKKIGEITGIAETESIQSVRYDKNICYLVTFRQTDPLFKIDLSDPTKPTILSEEKINGYSTYLVNYGENKLLGFGVDADDNGVQTGLKVSMFNTTNGEDVSEITSLKLGDDLQYAYSEALYNHKSLLIDPVKNLIGIPVSFYDGIDQCDRFYLISYTDADGFKIIGNIETHNIDGAYQFTRGMYINDVVYAFSQGRIVSASAVDMKKISSLDLIVPTSISENKHE